MAVSSEPNILRTSLDPHHEPYPNQWGWDGSHLYIRENVPTRRWVRVKRISFTPARVRMIADLIEPSGCFAGERGGMCQACDEAAELREENKRLSASVDDLLLAPNPLDDENMRLRTEVAELRAAIREWVEATDDAEMFELDQTNAYGDDHIDAEYRLEVARKVLLALAVTEGSES